MKDCFWTIAYKGHLIRGHHEDHIEVLSWLNLDTYDVTPVKTLLGAKRSITKYVKEHT